MSTSPAMRERLPNRRASETFSFECNALHYIATVSFFGNGRLGEIFITNAKTGSHSDSAARDSAIVTSIALQFGVPINVIQRALLRDPHGKALSQLGCALDQIEGVPCHDGDAVQVFARCHP